MNTATKTKDAGAAVELASARVATQYRFTRAAYIASPLNAALMMLALWGPVTAHALVAWFGATVLVTVARLLVQGAYLRGDRSDPQRWEDRHALGALASGAVWAAAPAIFMPELDPVRQMVLMLVVGGSVIGAAGMYSASARSFYGFILPPLAAVLWQFAGMTQTVYQVLALVVIVFAVLIVRVYGDLRGNVLTMLRAKIENEMLTARLSASEARLRDAIASLPDGIAIYDQDDRLAVCNEVYAQLYGAGKRPEELLGVTFLACARGAFDAERVPDEFTGRREEWIENLVAQRRRGNGEVRHYQMRDGRWKHARYVHTGLGSIVSLVNDVTEVKAAQEAFIAVLEHENLLLETLPLGVAFVEDRTVVRCNRQLEIMLGYGPRELDRRAVRGLYGSAESWLQACESFEGLRGAAVAEHEAQLAMADGQLHWFRLQVCRVGRGGPQESLILCVTDTAERRSAEEALRRSEATFRNLVETSNDLVWSLDTAGRWTYLNEGAARRIYGFEPAEMIGHGFGERAAPQVRERDEAVFRRVLLGEAVFDYETRHLARNGGRIDLSFNAIALRDGGGSVIGATGTARDVTEQRAAAAALQETVGKLRLAVEAADLYYWEWDPASGQMQFGPNPLSAPDSSRSPWLRVDEFVQRVVPEDRERFLAAGCATFERGEPYACQYRVLDAGGAMRWFEARGRPIHDASGKVARMIGVSRDITEGKRAEDEVRFLAYHDPLTGLPNRRLLDDRLKQAVYMAQRRDGKIGLMLVDLDDFKQVNDVVGHRAGDAVLREVAQRLSGCVRKADTLARQGGDEFVIVIPDLGAESDCSIVAEKILKSLEADVVADDRKFRIGASIGISVCPSDAGDGEALLRNADTAMYRAKQLGRNNYRFYGR